MKAGVLPKVDGPFVIEEVELLRPQPGEVCVRMAAARVCHSDWHFVTGHLARPFPAIVDYEEAGIAEEVSEGVTSLDPGQV